MSILTEKLPNTLKFCGKVFDINTDFRAGIELELMAQHGETNPVKLALPFLGEEYLTEIEITRESIKEVMQAVELFYSCGKAPEERTEKDDFRKPKIAYSFDVDANVIVADFWNYYNIDLTQEGLHWWLFRALLDGLPSQSEFRQRIYYRTCELKGLPKGEQKRIRKIRADIEIKTDDKNKLTLEQRNANMKAYIAKRARETAGGVNIGE